MNHYSPSLLRLCLVCINLAAALTSLAQSRFDFSAQGLDVIVTFYSSDIVRVTKAPHGAPIMTRSFSVTMKPQAGVAVTTRQDDHGMTLSTSRLNVSYDRTTGAITFRSADGKTLLRDKPYGTQFTAITDGGQPSYSVRQAFLLDPDEIIFGLGQQQTGRFNQRGQRLELRNVNMNICIPFVHSEKGYGLYWDNQSPTTFTDNPQELSFDSEVGRVADYYVLCGGSADGVVRLVRTLTGDAPLYPLWTLGFWQSRERYKSPEELLEVIDRYRQLISVWKKGDVR